ncbi:MAG: GNAT family N-acetyltransferase [Alsobacter sp.]
MDSLAALAPAEWDGLFPGDPEGWAFYRAVEEAGPPDFAWRYVLLERSGEIIAAAPAFVTPYRLDTTAQGPLRRATDQLARLLPSVMTLRLAALGSPVAEGCHLGFAPSVAVDERAALLDALLDAFEAMAERESCALRGVKDATGRDRALWDSVLEPRGYTRLPALPTGVLDLPEGGVEGYWKTLGRATRKDIRRKLRARDALRVEVRDRIDDLTEAVGALYDQTVARSELTFEHLPAAYFAAVLRWMPNAKAVLYWQGERLVAFNFVIETQDRLVDKYIGMDYAVARDLNLYFVSWMTNVEACVERGVPVYQSGQAFYGPKVRLGCRLSPNWMYFRHRNFAVNLMLRGVARLVRLDRFDPEIARLVGDTA